MGAFRRPNVCTIWASDCLSTGMSAGGSSNMRSTALQHLQMPQQVMFPPQEMRPQPEMVVDVLGVRVPVSLLDSGAFWLFLVIVAATLLGLAYFKFRSAK